MKHVTFVLVMAAAIGLLITAVFPQSMLGGEDGSDKKGKYYYKKSCKTCHGKDGDGGELTPMSKTQAQWGEYFEKGKHQDKDLKEIVDEKQIIHIQTFLINHAADSDQPETCG